MINRQAASYAVRIAASVLALSASAFVSLGVDEGYIETAKPPVAGDVDTKGFGTTVNADGSKVKRGEKTDPVRALIDLGRDVDAHERGFKQCIGDTPLFQHEYDSYIRLTYNVGVGAVCKSSIPAKLKAGKYQEACETIRGFVCGPASEKTQAKPGEQCYSARKPRRVLRGLQIRREAEYQQCIGNSNALPS